MTFFSQPTPSIENYEFNAEELKLIARAEFLGAEAFYGLTEELEEETKKIDARISNLEENHPLVMALQEAYDSAWAKEERNA